MRLKTLPLLLAAGLVMAQGAPKSADAARQAFMQVLDAVDATWFGQPYQGVTAVEVQGTLGIALSGAAVNRKVDQLSQGAVKADSKGGQANLLVKGTYFANGDFKTDMAGDFGHLLYARRGDRGFLYSKEQNAYTTRVDLPPTDAPLTYMAWFRQTLNDIKAVYLDGTVFKPSLGGEETSGGRTLQRIVFSAPTQPWDSKKREQSLAQSLGFWRRGHLVVLVDKATHLPYRMDFRNDEQGVQTRMDFNYGAGNRLEAVNLSNSSRGFEGPGWLRIGYGPGGQMNHVAGELGSQDKRVSFALDLAWSRSLSPAAIAAMPPAGATKRGREELETQLMIGLAGQIFDLQRRGLNLRSVAVGAK
ncbi:MAG TPA: hypothetical protein VF804_10300 [Holophagaceae bacterium]